MVSRTPQIAAITPDGNWAYVTDSTTGELSVIALATDRVVDRVPVGAGAHHLTISPDEGRTWVALGESASTIVVLDTSRPNRPRVLGRFHPAALVHDLVFAPDGRSVWLGAARKHRLRLPARRNDPPRPRDRSGRAAAATHRLRCPRPRLPDKRVRLDDRDRRRAHTPHPPSRRGAIRLLQRRDARGRRAVLVASRPGVIGEFNGANLARWYSKELAPVTRDLALTVW